MLAELIPALGLPFQLDPAKLPRVGLEIPDSLEAKAGMFAELAFGGGRFTEEDLQEMILEIAPQLGIVVETTSGDSTPNLTITREEPAACVAC